MRYTLVLTRADNGPNFSHKTYIIIIFITIKYHPSYLCYVTLLYTVLWCLENRRSCTLHIIRCIRTVYITFRRFSEFRQVHAIFCLFIRRSNFIHYDTFFFSFRNLCPRLRMNVGTHARIRTMETHDDRAKAIKRAAKVTGEIKMSIYGLYIIT